MNVNTVSERACTLKEKKQTIHLVERALKYKLMTMKVTWSSWGLSVQLPWEICPCNNTLFICQILVLQEFSFLALYFYLFSNLTIFTAYTIFIFVSFLILEVWVYRNFQGQFWYFYAFFWGDSMKYIITMWTVFKHYHIHKIPSWLCKEISFYVSAFVVGLPRTLWGVV